MVYFYWKSGLTSEKCNSTLLVVTNKKSTPSFTYYILPAREVQHTKYLGVELKTKVEGT